MRVLLDTNILIYREAAKVHRKDIGVLFHWLDKLHYDKYIHHISILEIQSHEDPQVRSAFETKLAAYQLLSTQVALDATVSKLSAIRDRTSNDTNDSVLLNEVVIGRVDALVSEDRGIHRKARELHVNQRVFTIQEFLEKVTSENPNTTEYVVPTVKRSQFGSVDHRSSFFDSFRADYPEFDRWFLRKSEEYAYVSYQGTELTGFLYVKQETENELYTDITPRFKPARRLKIGTFKVALNGFKLGERFLKIVFDNAIEMNVESIYVTIFASGPDQKRLVELLQEFGFRTYGTKGKSGLLEEVLERDMTPQFNRADPKVSFPYISRSSQCHILPIYPEYHTSLFPDSILKTESPSDFVELEPHRNAIKKVYVSRSIEKEVRRGDTLVFYRTGGLYKGVVTTIGVVEGIVYPSTLDEFIHACQKRSVFNADELRNQWDYSSYSRPFVVGFLYCYSLPRRPNLQQLISKGVIENVESAPRGFKKITQEQFAAILSLSGANKRLVVDQTEIR